jgi:hypothetical protein
MVRQQVGIYCGLGKLRGRKILTTKHTLGSVSLFFLMCHIHFLCFGSALHSAIRNVEDLPDAGQIWFTQLHTCWSGCHLRWESLWLPSSIGVVMIVAGFRTFGKPGSPQFLPMMEYYEYERRWAIQIQVTSNWPMWCNGLRSWQNPNLLLECAVHKWQ